MIYKCIIRKQIRLNVSVVRKCIEQNQEQMIILHFICHNDEFISRLLYGRLHCTLQFIAIEITIMHKIQIEWNSICHSLMGLEWGSERSLVPLWVLYWVWMQCTSSWLFQKKCNSPPSPVTELSCPEPEANSDYYKRCVSFVRSLRRGFRLYRMLVLAREVKEGGERCEEWEQEVGDICPCLRLRAAQS